MVLHERTCCELAPPAPATLPSSERAAAHAAAAVPSACHVWLEPLPQ
jgi:hypothetical protein